MQKRLTAAILLLGGLLLSSCGEVPSVHPLEGKTIVYEYRRDHYGYWKEGTGTLDYITKEASAIITCMVRSIEKIDVLKNGMYRITYNIEIGEILFDESGKLEPGDVIPVCSWTGLLKASEVKPLIENDIHENINKTLPNAQYADNEYVFITEYVGAPLEIGASFVIYLSDEKLEEHGYYEDISFGTTLRFDGLEVRSGRAYTLNKTKQLGEYITEIEARINRVK